MSFQYSVAPTWIHNMPYLSLNIPSPVCCRMKYWPLPRSCRWLEPPVLSPCVAIRETSPVAPVYIAGIVELWEPQSYGNSHNLEFQGRPRPSPHSRAG